MPSETDIKKSTLKGTVSDIKNTVANLFRKDKFIKNKQGIYERLEESSKKQILED